MTLYSLYDKFSDQFEDVHSFIVFDSSGCIDDFDKIRNVLNYYGDYNVVEICNNLNLFGEYVVFIYLE